MKIVIIGAGSRDFGRGQITDLCLAEELYGHDIELVLVDVDDSALQRQMRFAKQIVELTGADYRISAETNRCKALPEAAFVITAVARKRETLWEQDFRVPLALGFPHILGENGGPGALFHALRSLELIIPICRDIEKLCPEAWLFNFTNPEARVLNAILHLTTVKATGLCHGVFSAIRSVARYLDLETEELEVTSAGMNHFYCVLKAVEKTTGRDRLPEALEKAQQDEHAPPLFRKIAQVFDVFTFPGDDHIGEYLSYGTEYHGVMWGYGQETHQIDAAGEEVASDSRELSSRDQLRPSGEIAVPVIKSLILGQVQRFDAVNVLNSEGFIDNLPRGAAVEVPALADGQGVHPLKVGSVPETMATYMRTQFSIHELITKAWQTRSRKLLLQALLLDPCVNSISGAEKLIEHMLWLQKDFLPEFS